MRYFTNMSALVAVVYGASCENGGDMVCDDGKVCVYRYTSDISNPKDSDYKKLLKKDK